jgi:hypothetical protein
MTNLPFIPNWFFGYDILLELTFAIITLIVTLFAFKIYKLTRQRQPKLFAISFLFISLSYFVRSFVNFAIVMKLNENICQALKIVNVNTWDTFGVYVYIILFMIGLITLTYMTCKIASPKMYLLLLSLTIFSLLLSTNALSLYYVMSSILLIFIVIHYFKNYVKRKQAKTLLVLIAFVFLFFGNVHFIFSVNHGLFYIIGHFLELGAYSLILTNLILVIKK